MKWSLNRAEQARKKRALEYLCGPDNGGSTYKPAQPTQVMKSEKLVKSVLRFNGFPNGGLHQLIKSTQSWLG